jgi:AmmeMemoRadiSam system protein B
VPNKNFGGVEMIRMPAVAGSFYPGDENELETMIHDFLDQANVPELSGTLKGIIVPHAGYIYSAPVAAYAYKLLSKQKKIILIGPSHHGYFEGLAESGCEAWNTPLGITPVYELGNTHSYPAAHNPEHSLEVQLPFLQIVLSDFSIAPVLTGNISPDDGAELIDNGDFLVVSSDLSHYKPYDDAVAIDRTTIELIENLDLEGFLKNGDACGKTGIAIAMALAKKHGWKIKKLNYANSGDTAGPKTGVVGYAAFAILEG